MKCAWCEEEFEPTRKTQRFCKGKGCNQKAANRRRYEVTEGAEYQPARLPKRRHPEGWEPGVTLSGEKGTITTRPTTDRDPRWDSHLKEWGFDPDDFEVLEPVQVRTWDAAIGGGEVHQMWYYRANIVRRRHAGARVDVETLAKEIRRHKPRAIKPPEGDDAFVLALADWQIGKLDGGGTKDTTDRVLAMLDAAVSRINALRKMGHPLGSLYLLGLGDLFEGCDGHYAMQTFTVDMDRRGQMNVIRRLLLQLIRELAPRFSRVVCACCGGNHGENRRNGKAYTTFADNDDVAVFEQVHDAIKENPDAYGHVNFVIPTDDLTVTLDIAGNVLGIAHGHQARGAGTPQQKVLRWWGNQMRGDRPIGDARVLLTGHFHHLEVHQDGPRTWFSAPTLDGGSRWFSESAGMDSKPGTLSFVMGERGWDHVAIL